MKIFQRTFHAVVLAATLAAAPAFAADGIAFITDMKGEVALDGNPRPTLLAELAAGQKLTLGKDAQAFVMYVASGKEYVLKGPGEYLIAGTEISSKAGAPPTTRNTEWRTTSKVLVQVAQTSAASVRMRSVAQPKADTAPKLLFPTEGSVSTLQPTFRWRTAEAKAPSEFALVVVGQEKPVLQVKASGNTYRVAAKLKPDTDYAWTVTSAGSEVGTARFRTLSSEAQRRIDGRKPGDKSDFSDRVLFTLLLHEMGANQEAQESWARLAQERKDLPELAALAK